MEYVIILLYIGGACGQNNFSPVSSCTDIKLRDIPEEVYQRCTEPEKGIHCLPNENDDLGLSCFSVTWISAGRCPYYNSYQGNMDEKDCNRKIGQCSDSLYKSPNSLHYKGCYAKENVPTTTEAATTTEMKPTTRESPPRVNTTFVSCANRTIGPNSNIREECQCAVEKVFLSIFLVSSVILLSGIILKWKWKVISTQCKGGSRDQQTQKRSKDVAMPLTNSTTVCNNLLFND